MPVILMNKTLFKQQNQMKVMKTKMWKMMLIALVTIPMALVSCHDDLMIGISGHGEIVEETIQVNEFTGFVSTIAADIYLKQGDTQEVVIVAQQNIIDNIDIDWFDNGVWTIGYRDIVRYAKPVKIYITVPDLTKAVISGSGNVTGLTPFVGLDRLRLLISGSGSMDLDVEANQVDAAVSGSGNIQLAGNTDKVELLISGSGSFRAADMVTGRADITISGSGGARITVEEYLNVHVTGSGNIYYYGNPEIDVHVSGSGSVIHGQ
jgi:hypothetical protein